MAAADHEQNEEQIRILLVEDDEDLRRSLADYLRLNNLSVVEAGSGLGCYQAIRRDRFDVAILDVNLPDTDGFTLARDIVIDQSVGVIILTARAEREDRVRSFLEGADIFLTKPVNGEELLLALNNLVRRVRSREAPGGVSWRLDVSRQRLLSPDGRDIALSGRECALIKRLAEAHGETVPRSLLIEYLGYAHLPPESRSLDAVLRRLRQKADVPVRSIHSRGLLFAAEIKMI
jgi:two-component system, OmpR family, response regulator